ncbi:MAG: AsmA-like C-terminal region-containing protein, partial [Alphaproteobacteria bacterium]|nr:AsmA-like C-terminal region-containing protein [Alphaproteobacteria bacterium]
TGTLAAADIRLSGPKLSATGKAQFDAAGALARLDIPAVKAGKANDFALVLNRGADASLDLSIKGASLDGTSLASGGKGTTKGPSKEQKFPGPFHIVAQLDRIVLRDGVSLNNFSLDTSGVEDRLRTFTLSGKFARGPELSGAMQDKGSTRNLTLKTTDAGLLMKGVFGLDSIRGGKVSLAIDFPRPADQVPAKTDDDYKATLVAEDFRVMNQPFLTRLFSAGSLTGIIDLMSGQGIAIDKMTVPFTARDGSLRIRDARASGPAIGISADGYLDRNRNEIALRGTIAPVYGINSLLGAIPLVGNVLVSKKGEGVFGVTYSVSGNADEPHISVNPLAMLTPGILRRIFEGRIPTEKPAVMPVPAPAPPEKGRQESPKSQPATPKK